MRPASSTAGPWWWCALLVVLGVCIETEAAATPPRRFEVAPTPAWVTPIAPELDAPVPRDKLTGGFYDLLFDTQNRVGDPQRRYSHVAQVIVSSAGVQSLGTLEIEFDPSFESLSFHFVRVHRDGAVLDVFDPAAVRVSRRESELEQNLLDGALSAVLVVRDLRVGDVLEYAYSIGGGNPALGGRFALAQALDYRFPVRRLHRRIVAESRPDLRYRLHGGAPEPRESVRGDVKELVWDLEIEGATPEDGVPAWYQDRAWVQFSEFSSWAEVARWAAPLYAQHPRDPAVVELAASIEAKASAPAERALAAVRFVQDEVRYLGLEHGAHAVVPHAPGEVLARRYGDCKDKSLLLVTLLRELDLEADVALVDFDARRSLDQVAPSPFAFDHAIVRAVIDGEPRWIDATDAMQGGSIDSLAVTAFERALLVDEASTALTKIPARVSLREPSFVVEEVFDLRDPNAATLSVTTTYRGDRADQRRDALLSESRAELSTTFEEFYSGQGFRVRSSGLPKLDDDRERNVIVMTERYELEPPAGDSIYVEPHALVGSIPARVKPGRRAPLAIPSPLGIEHIVRIELASELADAREAANEGGFALSLAVEGTQSGHTVTLRWALHGSVDHLSASDAVAWGQHTDAMRARLGWTVDFERGIRGPVVVPTAETGCSSVGWVLAGFFLVALGAITFARVLDHLARRARLRRMHRHRPGEGADTAVTVADLDAVDWRALAPCACGGPLGPTAEEGEQVQYGGATLHIVRGTCERCGARAGRYLRVAGESAAVDS